MAGGPAALCCVPLLLLLSGGCGGPSKPDGFPAVVQPVTVKIVKGGQPLSGVSVILHAKDSDLRFLVSGITGADGVASLKTSRGSYSRSGAPTGKYLVQLTEELPQVDMPPLSMDATPQEQDTWSQEHEKKLDVVRNFPKVLNDVVKSPLELDVASPSAGVEFDVDKYK